jgi:hypothetical protein
MTGKAMKRKPGMWCPSCQRSVVGIKDTSMMGGVIPWYCQDCGTKAVASWRRPSPETPTKQQPAAPTPKSYDMSYDPWLSAVGMALMALGYVGAKKSTGADFGGVQSDADVIASTYAGSVVHVALFSTTEVRERAGELLANDPRYQKGSRSGAMEARVRGRVVLIADGQGKPLPPGAAERALAAVSRLAIKPPGSTPNVTSSPRDTADAPSSEAESHIEQIRKLGELKDAGILSEAEFEAKKTDLLGRI